MANFNKGDAVVLKSGSPAMTVKIPRDSNGETWCEWWNDKAGKFEERSFDPASLEIVRA